MNDAKVDSGADGNREKANPPCSGLENPEANRSSKGGFTVPAS